MLLYSDAGNLSLPFTVSWQYKLDWEYQLASLGRSSHPLIKLKYTEFHVEELVFLMKSEHVMM